ncbi:MAG: hypothetical protein QFX38_02100 [Methanothermobacter sp.]|nr:hypothetical protein [Methanothermobacter sp.]
MDSLWVIIKVTVKNKANRPYYFKIGQAYQDHLAINDTIKWTIEWTDPPAVKMAKSRFPELGGDYGWEIDPGQTRTVSFELKATGPFGDKLSYLYPAGEDPTYYWPLVSEPGLYTSWFMPNELETLNPDLKIVKWTGTFGFSLKNIDNDWVYGIVRAPIVPSNSKLTYSYPKVDFIDYESVPGAYVAAWDVALPGRSYSNFEYTYEWPAGAGEGYSYYGTPLKSNLRAAAGEYPSNKTTTVPGGETGAPWGPLLIGVLVTVAAIAYTRLS